MNRATKETIHRLALEMTNAGADGTSEAGCCWCLTRGNDADPASEKYTVAMAVRGLHLLECPAAAIAILSKPAERGGYSIDSGGERVWDPALPDRPADTDEGGDS